VKSKDMEPKQPLISVIIPVYNGKDFIQDAIQSVLDQKYPNLEILVIDDGSTDQTREKIDGCSDHVTYIHQTNQGPGSARNTGLKLAKGEIIGFLDADDLWPNSRLMKLKDRIDQDSSIEVVLGHTLSKELPGVSGTPKNLLRPHILPVFGCGLFKRSIFDKVGFIDPALRYSEDQDWFLRAKEAKISMAILKDIVLIRQLHKNNMTSGTNWQDTGILEAVRKSLERRKYRGNMAADELPKLSDYMEDE
jgi:glycosyltransferase involved in cell wall biosynthesis